MLLVEFFDLGVVDDVSDVFFVYLVCGVIICVYVLGCNDGIDISVDVGIEVVVVGVGIVVVVIIDMNGVVIVVICYVNNLLMVYINFESLIVGKDVFVS